MTWRRGLIRLWIVGSAGWAVHVYDFFKSDMPLLKNPRPPTVVIVGTSLAVLLAGLIIAWVLRGFRR